MAIKLLPGGFLHFRLQSGNTNFRYHALTPEGRLAWQYTTGSNAWSAAARADDGTIYWGSLDGFLHAVAPGGALLWRAPSLGFIAASAALGRDGTVYVGSFDGSVRAYAAGGRPWPWPLPRWRLASWRFATRDHVYASPAQLSDGRLVVASTDGSVLRQRIVQVAPEYTATARDLKTRKSKSRTYRPNAVTGGYEFVERPQKRKRTSLRRQPANGDDSNAWPIPFNHQVKPGADQPDEVLIGRRRLPFPGLHLNGSGVAG